MQGLNEERGQMIGNINSLKNKLDVLIQKNREFEKILRDIETQKSKLEKQEDALKANCDQVLKIFITLIKNILISLFSLFNVCVYRCFSDV